MSHNPSCAQSGRKGSNTWVIKIDASVILDFWPNFGALMVIMNFLIIDACFLDRIITDHIKIDSARELSNAK